MVVQEIAKSLSKALTPIVGGASKELSGYLADHIRFFRWKSAIRIIERASAFAEQKHIDPKKIPIKFIVPFLEAASLEDVSKDKVVADMWASLFASTIDKHVARHVAYIDILKRLSTKEAKFLIQIHQKMIAEEIYAEDEFNLDLWNVGDKQAVKEDFVSAFEKRGEKILKGFESDTFAAFNVARNAMDSITKDITYRKDILPVAYEVAFYKGVEMTNGTSAPFKQLDTDTIANLTVLGLMERFEAVGWFPSVRAERKNVVRVSASFVAMTSMGFDFLRACGRTEVGKKAKKRKMRGRTP